MTPDDARRAALLATINTNTSDTPERPTNPYAIALGLIGGILLTVGVIVMLVAAGQAPSQPDGIVNLATLLTGSAIAAFGLIAILLLLAAQLIRWSPPAEAVE